MSSAATKMVKISEVIADHRDRTRDDEDWDWCFTHPWFRAERQPNKKDGNDDCARCNFLWDNRDA
jgi:hypothetical protein